MNFKVKTFFTSCRYSAPPPRRILPSPSLRKTQQPLPLSKISLEIHTRAQDIAKPPPPEVPSYHSWPWEDENKKLKSVFRAMGVGCDLEVLSWHHIQTDSNFSIFLLCSSKFSVRSSKIVRIYILERVKS